MSDKNKPAGQPPASPNALKPGDRVWYVPHRDHALDKDREGQYLFEFVHEKSDADPAGRRVGHVANMGEAGALLGRDRDGRLLSLHGAVLSPGRPKRPWPATVAAVPGGRLAADVSAAGEFAAPGTNFHAGMAVRCVDAPDALPENAAVAECPAPGRYRLSGPCAAPGLHLLEVSGGGLQLDVEHPQGTHVLHYKIDGGPNPVALDPSGERPHSFHRRAD